MVISANKFTYQPPVIINRGYDSNALSVEKFSKKLCLRKITSNQINSPPLTSKSFRVGRHVYPRTVVSVS